MSFKFNQQTYRVYVLASMVHCSWVDSHFDFEEWTKLQDECRSRPSKYAKEYQFNLIPVYDANDVDFNSKDVQLDVYKTFYDKSGAIIVKNVYSKETMDAYNRWCENTLEEAKVGNAFKLNIM